jgi:hypothetical protein
MNGINGPAEGPRSALQAAPADPIVVLRASELRAIVREELERALAGRGRAMPLREFCAQSHMPYKTAVEQIREGRFAWRTVRSGRSIYVLSAA